MNNPALTMVVIIDSAKGLHQGGQVSAPVFKRIAQQVLAYMNVPHDAEIKNDPRRKMLMASVKDRTWTIARRTTLAKRWTYSRKRLQLVPANASSKPTPVMAQPSGRSAEMVPATYVGMSAKQSPQPTASAKIESAT